MGKGHHWELCLWRLYLVTGPFLSLCFLAAIMDAELFYPDLHGMRSLSLWPEPQLWNQSAEQWLEGTKNNTLCKTQKGLWLPKREVGSTAEAGFHFSWYSCQRWKEQPLTTVKMGFPWRLLSLGSRRRWEPEALGPHGSSVSQTTFFVLLSNWLGHSSNSILPYTHLWFEYGKYPQVHMLSAWSPAAVLFWEDVVILGGRASQEEGQHHWRLYFEG